MRRESRGADVPEAGGVPVEAGARRRLARLNRPRDRLDIAQLRIDVERGRIVPHHRHDRGRVRGRPAGAAVAAPGLVTHKLAERHVALRIGVRARRIFQAADPPQKDGGMPADGARPGVRRIAFAVELEKRALKKRVASGRPIIALERGHGLAGHIIAAGGEIGIHRVAEILHAAAPVGEVRNPQIPPAAMASGNGAKRRLRLADDVEPPPSPPPPRSWGRVASMAK